MIAIIAVRPNVIRGRQYLFSPQIEPPVFIFWQNMIYCSKKYLFPIAFKLCFKDIFGKGKTGRAIFYRDSRLSAQSTDRLMVNKTDPR
jgi:hypothetical protein